MGNSFGSEEPIALRAVGEDFLNLSKPDATSEQIDVIIKNHKEFCDQTGLCKSYDQIGENREEMAKNRSRSPLDGSITRTEAGVVL